MDVSHSSHEPDHLYPKSSNPHDPPLKSQDVQDCKQYDDRRVKATAENGIGDNKRHEGLQQLHKKMTKSPIDSSMASSMIPASTSRNLKEVDTRAIAGEEAEGKDNLSDTKSTVTRPHHSISSILSQKPNRRIGMKVVSGIQRERPCITAKTREQNKENVREHWAPADGSVTRDTRFLKPWPSAPDVLSRPRQLKSATASDIIQEIGNVLKDRRHAHEQLRSNISKGVLSLSSQNPESGSGKLKSALKPCNQSATPSSTLSSTGAWLESRHSTTSSTQPVSSVRSPQRFSDLLSTNIPSGLSLKIGKTGLQRLRGNPSRVRKKLTYGDVHGEQPKRTRVRSEIQFTSVR